MKKQEIIKGLKNIIKSLKDNKEENILALHIFYNKSAFEADIHWENN